MAVLILYAILNDISRHNISRNFMLFHVTFAQTSRMCDNEPLFIHRKLNLVIHIDTLTTHRAGWFVFINPLSAFFKVIRLTRHNHSPFLSPCQYKIACPIYQERERRLHRHCTKNSFSAWMGICPALFSSDVA